MIATKPTATLYDLSRVEGKAELVNGEIVEEMRTGDEPGFAADEIFVSLREYAKRLGVGRAVGDNRGFRVVNLPHRESFSPDAAYYTGPSGGHGFFPEPPVFAVEVRSENDYTPRAEREMARKRRDYFDAGTEVIWDVAPLDEEIIVRKYSTPDAANPSATYRHGEIAEAEPAVPGWTMPVDDLFES